MWKSGRSWLTTVTAATAKPK
ncbi:KxYKxGKxW signal peptide domain-containing protein [Dyadobacter fermentans]